MLMYIHAIIHTQNVVDYKNALAHAWVQRTMSSRIESCLHICIHVYLHTCIYTYIQTYMHTWIHAYTHTCKHAYMHTCMRIMRQTTKMRWHKLERKAPSTSNQVELCNTLQHTATHCSTLQHTNWYNFAQAWAQSSIYFELGRTSQKSVHYAATHCSPLGHTATHCITLQHTAAHQLVQLRTSLIVTQFAGFTDYASDYWDLWPGSDRIFQRKRQVCVCVCVYTHSMRVHSLYARIHSLCVYTLSMRVLTLSQIHIYLHTCTCTCTFVNIFHVRVCVCIYIYMCVCIYT